MGKHSAQGSAGKAGRPRKIERLEPATESRETPAQQSRRTARPDFSERRRRKAKRKKVLIGCGWVLGFLVLAAIAAGLLYVRSINDKLQAPIVADEATVALLEESAPVERDAPFYMLLMGVDNREGETLARSDTLMVARVDTANEKLTLLSIPRDTRVDIPGEGTQKINAANALGGPELVIKTVQEFTGLPISHYAEVDFNGFKDVVDALGGVTVVVPERISDMKAANHDSSASVVEAGEQRLDGAHALTFVRSRNFPTGDFMRIQNQQTFLRAVMAESLKATNALKLPSMVNAVAEQVTTDMSVGELLALANKMRGMGDDGLETVTMPGESKTVGGASYVISDEEAFAAMLERIQAGEPAEETAEEVAASLSPGDVSVAVRNGAGIGGVAADASTRLKTKGFEVGEVGNMNQFVYDETLVVYEGDNEAYAELVATQLGKGKVVDSRGMYSFNTDVLLVVGTDWGPPPVSHTQQVPR